jgi:molybdopterin-binding protein
MNRLEGHIGEIRTHGHLSLVMVNLPGSTTLRAIVIESPGSADYLREGNQIAVLFKETEVILCTGDAASISIQNRIPATVRGIEAGTLLSRVSLDTDMGRLETIVQTECLDTLCLKEGAEVLALIKTNEVMLSAL